MAYCNGLSLVLVCPRSNQLSLRLADWDLDDDTQAELLPLSVKVRQLGKLMARSMHAERERSFLSGFPIIGEVLFRIQKNMVDRFPI